MGAEYDVMLFLILLYSLVDLHRNTLLSAGVTFLVDYIITGIRAWGGKHNLSQKCLVDDKFLI